jgi:hypothetical protein
LESGKRVSIDMKRAPHSQHLSGRQRLAAAPNNYERCLQNGDGLSIDVKEAYYHNLAEDSGHAGAQYNYGNEEFIRAAQSFQLAAEQRFPEAQYRYGI